jgi:hypothetical protein
MKMYNPKIKDSFIMQFGFPYPDQPKKKKELIKIYNKNEVLCT